MHNSIEKYRSIVNESEIRCGHRSNMMNVFNYHSLYIHGIEIIYDSKKIIYIYIYRLVERIIGFN